LFAPSTAARNKSDRNDAIGIARIMQTGWFKEVHVKDIDSHSVRALLASRALLVKIKHDLENHVRGLLKNLGLVIGRAKFNVFAVRAKELIEGHPELIAAIRPLLEARSATGSARPRLRSPVSSPSFCIACGSMEPSSTGRRRRLLPSKGITEFLPNGKEETSQPGRWRW
jgi:transposase